MYLILTFKAFPAPWLLFLLLLAVIPHSQGQVLLLDPVIQGKPLGEYIGYWVDESGTATIQDVQNKTGWRHVNVPIPNYGTQSQVFWFKLDVQSASDTDKWIMEIGYGLLDFLDIYLVDPEGIVLQHYDLGAARPLENRPLRHRFNLIPMPNSDVPNFSIYLRVRSYHSLQLPLSVWLEPDFVAHDAISNLALGLLFGCLAVMLLYNFFLYTNLRDPLYLTYVGLVLCFMLLQASMEGLGYRYIWNNAWNWSSVSVYFAAYSAAFFGTSFAIRFLELKQRKFRFFGLLSLMRWMCLFCALSIYWIPKEWSLKILSVLVFGIVLLGTIALVTYYRGNDRSVRIFTTAWALLLVGVVLLIANKLGMMPVNFWTEQTLALGTVLEMVLFSMALGDRINQEKAQILLAKSQYLHALNQEREANQLSLENEAMERKAKESTLNLQQQKNERLEQEVQEQTQELQHATERLQQLIRIDPLTNVFNRHYFNEQLQTYCSLDPGQDSQLCLMMVDIDHFKSINDRYGHRVGDQCIQWVANTIQTYIEDHNGTVFRYGGEEFAVLIPGIDMDIARDLAQSLCGDISEKHLQIEDGPSGITVSIGVLSVQTPHGDNPQQLIKLADKALYEAKFAGRNRIAMSDYKVRQRHG